MISLKYELLIRRAHQVDRFGRLAADAAKLNNLAEDHFRLLDNPTDKRLIKSFNKRFTRMQNDIITALSVSLDRVRTNPAAVQEINDCITDCQNANSYDDMLAVIEKGSGTFDRHCINLV
jgi:hypothetical protein